MRHNETTPGRGYPLPVPTNTLDVDVKKIREALQAIDADYLGLVLKWKQFYETAEGYLEKIDGRQGRFDDETAEAFVRFERRREELIATMKENHGALLREMRVDVDAEIERLTSLVPHYDRLEGDLYTAASTLPESGASPLEYVHGLGFFRYDAASAVPPDGEFFISPKGGKGRWVLVIPGVDFLFAALGRHSRKTPSTTKKILKSSGVLYLGEILSGGTITRGVYVRGAEMGDMVSVAPPVSLVGGLVFSGFVSGNNVVTIRVTNVTTSSIRPVNATWQASVMKEEVRK